MQGEMNNVQEESPLLALQSNPAGSLMGLKHRG